MFKRTLITITAVFALAASSALAASAPVRGPFAGAVHAVGSLADKSGNAISVTWDRGKIASLSDSSITLMRRDKQSVSFAITSSTTVRNDGATYSLSDLKTGLVATVVSQDGNAAVIRNIRGDGAPSGADVRRSAPESHGNGQICADWTGLPAGLLPSSAAGGAAARPRFSGAPESGDSGNAR